jgi:high-affinity nickel-transport protein
MRKILAGFDTASSIAILAISAIAKRGSDGKGIPPRDIVVLPVSTFIISAKFGFRWDLQLLFTAGMTLIDSVDSILMLYSYIAFAERNFAVFEKRETRNDLEEAQEATPEASAPSIKTTHAETEDSSETRGALRIKQNAMSGLSIILTVMSILVAFRWVPYCWFGDFSIVGYWLRMQAFRWSQSWV